MDWRDIVNEAHRKSGTWPWRKAAPETIGYPAVGYEVRGHEGWTVVVFQFSIEEQGFPPGSVGYDGAVRKGDTIVHIPHEDAERLWLVAHVKLGD